MKPKYIPTYPMIETRFLGATNNRGSRVKAYRNRISVTLSWNHELNGVDNHQRAAKALIKKLEWGASTLMTGESESEARNDS